MDDIGVLLPNLLSRLLLLGNQLPHVQPLLLIPLLWLRDQHLLLRNMWIDRSCVLWFLKSLSYIRVLSQVLPHSNGYMIRGVGRMSQGSLPYHALQEILDLMLFRGTLQVPLGLTMELNQTPQSSQFFESRVMYGIRQRSLQMVRVIWLLPSVLLLIGP